MVRMMSTLDLEVQYKPQGLASRLIIANSALCRRLERGISEVIVSMPSTLNWRKSIDNGQAQH